MLVNTYEQVEQDAPNAALYVVGYPDLLPPDPSLVQLDVSCPSATKTPLGSLSPSGTSYLAAAEVALDQTISEAASEAGAHFVDPNLTTEPKSFLGHDVCENKKSWFNAPNPVDPVYSLHPNAAGQNALAKDVEGAITKDSTPTGPLADSITGYSDVQGGNGWSYGYYADPPSTDFTPMTVYQSDADLAGVLIGQSAWLEDPNNYWTLVGQEVQHPESTTTSGGRVPTNQWSVRRWTSDYSGKVLITGSLAKSNVSCGDGVTGHIIVNGVDIDDISIAFDDAVGSDFSVPAQLSVGSTVDFALDPNSSDVCDGTDLIGMIQREG